MFNRNVFKILFYMFYMYSGSSHVGDIMTESFDQHEIHYQCLEHWESDYLLQGTYVCKAYIRDAGICLRHTSSYKVVSYCQIWYYKLKLLPTITVRDSLCKYRHFLNVRADRWAKTYSSASLLRTTFYHIFTSAQRKSL